MNYNIGDIVYDNDGIVFLIIDNDNEGMAIQNHSRSYGHIFPNGDTCRVVGCEVIGNIFSIMNKVDWSTYP